MTPQPLPGYRSRVYATSTDALAALCEMPGGSTVMVPNERWGFIEYSKAYEPAQFHTYEPPFAEGTN